MPIYEFNCHECCTPFESLVMGFNTEKVQCPVCESKDVKKKISSFAVKANVFSSNSFSTDSGSCNTGST